jgi:hypothetical protein
MVVAWATVRLFLVLSLVLEWKTASVDFASAFVQAPLRDPIASICLVDFVQDSVHKLASD